LDFIQWSSVACKLVVSPVLSCLSPLSGLILFVRFSGVTTIDYYLTFILISLAPLILLAGVAILYLGVYYCQTRNPDRESMLSYMGVEKSRARRLVKFTKLVLFTLFLVYPKLSSTLFTMYGSRVEPL
jgi:hypothetical protein